MAIDREDDLDERLSRGCVLQTAPNALAQLARLSISMKCAAQDGIAQYRILTHSGRSRSRIGGEPEDCERDVQLCGIVDMRDGFRQEFTRNRDCGARTDC
jgi:hypothetical protein